MAEILIKAVDHIHPNTTKDRRGAYKRGMPVVVMPDGHTWGSQERLPKFVVVKIPGVPVERVKKYIMPQMDGITGAVYRRRLWQIRWADLPTRAKNILSSTGVLIIRVGSYSGDFDYTWNQIKSYFRNLRTGLDESEEL